MKMNKLLIALIALLITSCKPTHIYKYEIVYTNGEKEIYQTYCEHSVFIDDDGCFDNNRRCGIRKVTFLETIKIEKNDK